MISYELCRRLVGAQQTSDIVSPTAFLVFRTIESTANSTTNNNWKPFNMPDTLTLLATSSFSYRDYKFSSHASPSKVVVFSPFFAGFAANVLKMAKQLNNSHIGDAMLTLLTAWSWRFFFMCLLNARCLLCSLVCVRLLNKRKQSRPDVVDS